MCVLGFASLVFGVSGLRAVPSQSLSIWPAASDLPSIRLPRIEAAPMNTAASKTKSNTSCDLDRSQQPAITPRSSHASVTVVPGGAFNGVSGDDQGDGGAVQGSVRPPGSKSLTNRALVCAAFASGTSRLTGSLVSEDTEVMIASLSKVGVKIESLDAGRTLVVEGVTAADSAGDELNGPPIEMFIANSGTTVRFLTAALSAFGGKYRLSGVDRMHERPIGDLVDAISPAIDGSITAVSDGGCPPVEIDAKGWSGRSMSVAGGVSSQYLSGLMMAGPIASKPIELKITGQLVSIPYVRMTAKLMEAFGGQTDWDLEASQAIRVSGSYSACDYAIEPDASAASYFWAAAAVSGGRVTVEGLSEDALQGDVGFVRVLEQMGCEVNATDHSIEVVGGDLHGVDVNMSEISDTVQTLAVVALFADSPTRVRGVAHNRFKETDRIGNLAIELRKLGAQVDEHEDGLTIHPLPAEASSGHGDPVEMETYNDHRMAMSFAVAGLRIPNVRILNPACTGKTYPEFWADLEKLTGRPHHWQGGLTEKGKT
ncbi:3-phosphoshikimate 1-carboxyvinyltransferase [Neorhodopirellula lusitana]|uniref:3-phosphoshikimate 1-carboxyvinyltransferase n=2 Tax=Neorhodopirellula lusitana TaxID=445327 RepID=A0ABY1QMP8_9BACT|nr:3-phosphoshikimate 1-carboxyvinyltransferase [Neorhodopirellula lusitana]